ncbi:MAG: 6-carboxytetrahydropterin synthase [Deltaproteobacteria bacterium]|nr:6-carboxytetrahydropterin synthase [Deltaproteobacteria bacterium]
MDWRFCFEAAHSLPNVPEGHKCRRIHGHSYVVEVVVLDDSGCKRERVDEVVGLLAHRYLNDIEGLENPTAEHLCHWIWGRLATGTLKELRIFENADSVCIYRGE